MSRPPPDSGILRNWYWIWLVNAVFVAAMVYFFFFRYPGWYHYTFRGISLAHEMNYAVWWSGICLVIAGIIFANVGSMVQARGGRAWIWYVMGLAMLALCIDEVGSLHENVARVGGWLGLAPFALVFSVAFGAAFLYLLGNRATRIVAVLIFVGFAIFIAVAGMEFLEHLETFRHHFWRRVRQVGEEAFELIAMGILITAGLIAMRRMGDPDRRFHNATRVVGRLLEFPFAMFVLFVVQMTLTAAVVIPNYSFFLEGNPSALYPMLMFFCLGILARQHAVAGGGPYFTVLAWVFYITSILQLYNLNVFLNHVFTVNFPYLTGPPLSWMATLVGFGLLALRTTRAGRVTWRNVGMQLLLLALLCLLVYPDLKYPFRLEYHYFLFSSAVAWSCYQLLATLVPKPQKESHHE